MPRKPPSTTPSRSASDPASDILHDRRRGLDAIFAPRRVAVVGATDRADSVGRTVLWNLLTNPFGGTLFPVNPRRDSVLGIKAYRDLAAVPERVDLAVVVTPADTVPGVIADCVRAGVRGAVILSAGFREVGEQGAALERQVLEEARKGPLRIVGPNCLGIMNPGTGLNATFASGMARLGRVAFLSQSGALCTAVLDWSLRENVGFSAFVSVGAMVDVGWGDLIDYFGDDPRTQAILLYMETIGDARAFLSAAREVALSKPIIVIKPGRTAAAARAAVSHTGSLAGSDEVLEAAFRRSGVLRVATISELFHMAETLGKQPRPHGPRLTIVTNAGGPAVIAADALLMNGGQLAELSPGTLAELSAVLPPAWSHNNPIDVLGDADAERYAKAVEIAARDPASDGVLVIFAPQALTDATQTAERLRALPRPGGKPLLASWMGAAEVAAGEAILNRAGIPTFAYPDTAARVFDYMWAYTENLKALYETSVPPEDDAQGPDRVTVAQVLEAARRAGRTILTETESKRVLAAYGIPTIETRVAVSADEAIAVARTLGFPVAVKVNSETITHKADVGGVQLDIRSAEGVRQAYRAIEKSVAAAVGASHFQGVAVQPMIPREGYEVILGSSVDAQLGPVLLFGTGGSLVEVYRDHAIGLPPLTTTLARRLMERTRIFQAFGGVRGRAPVDVGRLEALLVRFSQMVVEQPRIREIDINPLLVSAERLLALDARIVLHGHDVPDEALPVPAIRPYPRQYVHRWKGRDGTPLTIRPIRPEDEDRLRHFHATLSDRTVYMRYLHPMMLSQRVSHERLARICFVDYAREIVLVAERPGESGAPEIVGVGRLSRLRWRDEAEFALLISDAYQGRGLGGELLRTLVKIGRQERLRRIVGYISVENAAMLRLARAVGFDVRRSADDPAVADARIDL